MKHTNCDQTLFNAARKDAVYQSLLARCREAEAGYRELLERLPLRQQEALEKYIDLSVELEHRLTQLALELPRA